METYLARRNLFRSSSITVILLPFATKALTVLQTLWLKSLRGSFCGMAREGSSQKQTLYNAPKEPLLPVIIKPCLLASGSRCTFSCQVIMSKSICSFLVKLICPQQKPIGNTDLFSFHRVLYFPECYTNGIIYSYKVDFFYLIKCLFDLYKWPHVPAVQSSLLLSSIPLYKCVHSLSLHSMFSTFYDCTYW